MYLVEFSSLRTSEDVIFPFCPFSAEKKKAAQTFLGEYIPLNMSKERQENESGSTEEPEYRQTCGTEEVESDSDSSVSSGICDDSLMMQYGA